MSGMRRKYRKDYMLEILNRFIAEHGGDPVDPDEVFAWAREQGLWEPEPKSIRQQFKEELARAAREEYYTDPQGRTVRRKHAVVLSNKGVQQVLWADDRTAPKEHLHLSFQQRRRGIGGDVRQLKVDLDSVNENRFADEPIPMSFNFDEDLAEGQHPTDYPDEPPDGSEDEGKD